MRNNTENGTANQNRYVAQGTLQTKLTTTSEMTMDRITAEQRSANMRKITSKGMKPEMFVRRLVHRLGYRFRLHRSDLPGKPDLVFAGRKKVIFVHGCFWHQHEDSSCKLAHSPRTNTAYWRTKLARNVERDGAARKQLEADGWSVLVLWECRLKEEVAVAQAIASFLGPAKTKPFHSSPR